MIAIDLARLGARRLGRNGLWRPAILVRKDARVPAFPRGPGRRSVRSIHFHIMPHLPAAF
jgi:hypothetical protein